MSPDTDVQCGQCVLFKSCLPLGKWNPLVLPWQAGSSSSRATKINHNEPRGLDGGCAVFKTPTKDTCWEQITVTYVQEGIKELNLIGRWWVNFMGRELSSLILVVCKSRKMGVTVQG